MTAKERLHELVDEMSEPEAERALKIVEEILASRGDNDTGRSGTP